MLAVLVAWLALYVCTLPFLVKMEHICRWRLCPYKSYKSFPGVIYTGSKQVDSSMYKTEVWYLDSLHMAYPDKDYDGLEDMLTKLHIKKGGL